MVTILESNHPLLKEQPNKDLVWFEVKRLLSDGGDHFLHYKKDGVVHVIEHSNTHPDFQYGHDLIPYKWLHFKPVDWVRPKKCSH